VRNEEMEALSETLKILTGDEARDLFSKTMSFVQTSSTVSAKSMARARMQDKLSLRAMQRLMSVARLSKNTAMMGLAVRVRLDAFTKVKEEMDKMLGVLKKEQQEEYEKNELCKQQIDETEDSIKEAENKKEDLAEVHKEFENTLASLGEEIKTLKLEIKDMEISLKQAGEERKDQNKLFQSQVDDQRATIEILNMALGRLKDFYENKKEFLQVAQVLGLRRAPAKPGGYEKNAASGGVMQLIGMIIKQAGRAEKELMVDEQASQNSYLEYVADATASIQASRDAVAAREKEVAEAEAGKSETEGAQLSNDQEVQKMKDLLLAHHHDCDFVMKYIETRQKSRQEEMDGIQEAKAILSGA
jgi:hypothetical protein